jgi:hypothetical protein
VYMWACMYGHVYGYLCMVCVYGIYTHMGMCIWVPIHMCVYGIYTYMEYKHVHVYIYTRTVYIRV